MFHLKKVALTVKDWFTGGLYLHDVISNLLLATKNCLKQIW